LKRGEVLDAAEVLLPADRTWTVSNGQQTFFSRYGEWFAWLLLAGEFGFDIFWLLEQKN